MKGLFMIMIYEVYLTHRGRLRVRRTRIKHHEPNPGLLKKYVVEARHRWIKGRRPRGSLGEHYTISATAR